VEELLVEYWPQVGAVIAIAMAWGDIRRSQKSHQETTRSGFEGVHMRLDKVNGRIDKAEDRLRDHGERLARGGM
jgi:hypothetical protein